MPTTAILFGAILIVIGVVGYVIGVMDGKASVTALIPAFFGIVLAILGLASRAKENLRKHLMHVAVVVALLGFIATAGRLISKMSELTASPAVIAQASMAIVCLAFVLLGIRSFAAARRDREG
jgi:uncharacterized membrane protein